MYIENEHIDFDELDLFQITFDNYAINLQVAAENEAQARFAVDRYVSEVLRTEVGEIHIAPFRPMLVTDGEHIDILAADNSGEYVGLA